MTAILDKSTLTFLKSLKKNNNRDWFNQNKVLYEDAKYSFEIFLDSLIEKTSEFDKTLHGLLPKDCMFRIYRDIRFSKNKSPYKTNFGAVIQKGGRKSGIAGYYFHLEPGNNSFLAGGLYMPPPEILTTVRSAIFNKHSEFKRIIKSRKFAEYFGEIWEGDKLKTTPKGFPKDHPSSEYLKYKSYIVSHELKDKQILSDSIIDYSAKIFKVMKPFNDFLNQNINSVNI